MSGTLPHHYRLPSEPHLWAGEYPGHQDGDQARARVLTLLDHGVSCFVDLTEVNELAPYHRYLRGLTSAGQPEPLYRRHPIPDVSVPASTDTMTGILDAIDDALADGHQVYVHCWGGIGRTGTTVGCWLVRQGEAGQAALAQVARLFGATAKGRDGRRASPETTAQRNWVADWAEAPRAVDPGRADRLAGALVGLAVGDALGTTLEFRPPGSFRPIDDMVGGGPFRLAPGQWTDDTSMARCLAESLVACHGFDAADQMRRYVRWWRKGYLSSTGRCFDIGNTTRAALARFEDTGNPMAGSLNDDSAGNGSLMRLAPVVIAHADQPRTAVKLAGLSSATTHGAVEAVDACRYFATLLLGAFQGRSKDALLEPTRVDRLGHWHRAPLDPRIRAVARGSFRRGTICGSGYVTECLEAALWAFATTNDFRSGALAAANLGDDADTTGAVYGQLAGAYYGLEGIPSEWRERLHDGPAIVHLARRVSAATGPAGGGRSDSSPD